MLQLVVINALHMGFVLGGYLYFGSIKKDFDKDSKELIENHVGSYELDKKIDMLKERHPERRAHLNNNTIWFAQFDKPDEDVVQNVSNI